MKMIDHIVEDLDEELEGAMHYAEKYIENRAKGETTRAAKFKEMASDELRHASFVHEMAVADIASIEKVFSMPVEDAEKWAHAHKHYVDCVGRVKMMLNM